MDTISHTDKIEITIETLSNDKGVINSVNKIVSLNGSVVYNEKITHPYFKLITNIKQILSVVRSEIKSCL